MSVGSSNEMFINMKDIPFYDGKFHYFEQKKSTLEFYEEEWKKINNGITIGGVFIHPWLYYHINYFNTPVPQENGDEKKMIAPLRDNEWYFMENYYAAEKARKGLAMFGSRRFGKSVLLASVLSWIALTKENGSSEVVGGSAPDLQQLTRLIKYAINNMTAAFKLPSNTKDWNKHIKFGVKNKDNEEIPYSDIFIKNAEDGNEKASEKGAGGSPVGFIVDEFGKYNCLKFLEGAIPAFKTPHGLKVVYILAGTGGNETLSADAKTILENPEIHEIIPMDWDLLDNKVRDKADITWKRTKFGMYIPPQMVYEVGLIKNDVPLSKYLDVSTGSELDNINIQETDWKVAKKVLNEQLDAKKKDISKWTRQKMYYPQDPEWCFLGNVDNPFPTNEAAAHRKKLVEEGKIGKDVNIFVKEGNILEYELSDKVRAPFPFKGGGIIDAPVVLFEDPPQQKPEYGENVSGLDPYKQAQSGTDSVGSLYGLKRKTDIATPIEQIVYAYSARPKTMIIFNRTCEQLIEGWNSECLMENADQSFLQYLDAKNKAEMLLADGVDWSKTVNPNSNPSTKLGYYPTEKNTRYLLSLVISYCWEKVVVGYEEDGVTPIEKLGVEFIPCIDLLQEIIEFNHTGNFDRIRAFGSALAWARHLDKMNVMPRVKKHDDATILRERERARALNKGFGFVKAKELNF